MAVAGNKVHTEEDVAFLRSHAGADLVTWLAHEPAIRAMEQGRPFGLSDLSAQADPGFDLGRAFSGHAPDPVHG
ncbi:MAG: hypothetical protein J2P25_01265 [Nocardiopsaceae bacterium]|nr:hypothetical protein [Nocardiopsaceae bacterium]